MILIVLLLLLFIMVFLQLLAKQAEGFNNPSTPTANPAKPLDKIVVDTYKPFAELYNLFLTTWEKAIISAASQEVERPPLQSPEDAPSGTPPTISRTQQNAYITKLSEQLKKPLPPITDPLPPSTSINISSLPMLMNQIPKDTAPYQHALDWMNNNLETAQNNLQKALKGIPFAIETFQSKCNGVSQCLLNNQEFITKVGDEVCSTEKRRQQQEIEAQQKELLKRMNGFLQNKKIGIALIKNQQLVKGAEKVKEQAESGEIYKQVQVQDRPTYTAPMLPGDQALSNLEKSNPQQYNQLKTNYSQWFNLKRLIEQINRSIR